jgi:tRNA pseudouridine55 synthase
VTAGPRPGALDGALVIDKPAGMTSHDVVASVRRALGGLRVGHTGTLDPMATGVLPLLLGRATRLAQFLAGATKSYEARIRFGWATTTYDAEGAPTGPAVEAPVDPDAVRQVLAGWVGRLEQRPPAFSAKRVEGRRAYDLARADRPPELPPVPVTLHAADVTCVSGGLVDLRVTCSSGFYVRSLAHDLGVALGTGAHLSALRRTASGPFDLERAVPLGPVLVDPALARQACVPMAGLLPDAPAVRLDVASVERVRRGQDVPGGGAAAGVPLARLLTPEGTLAAIAGPGDRPGFLHPLVVLM